MKTGIIKYNVKERGRKFRGQERNFDTAALAELINGPEVQERVKNRDLVGYFGHWPRIVFGMNPGEGGIYQGKHIPLEAAIVTTSLRAEPDGTISHDTEFLDTAPGRTAKRQFASKTGGFSSAINCREMGGRDVPLSFHGFDYVMEPNFTKNRGYALDGVFEGFEAVDHAMALDSVVSESAATLKVLDGLYTALQGDYDRMAAAVARMQQENEELLALLAAGGRAQESRLALRRLDSIYGSKAEPARRLDGVSPLERMAAEFKALPLADVQQPAQSVPDRVAAQLTSILNAGIGGLLR